MVTLNELASNGTSFLYITSIGYNKFLNSPTLALIPGSNITKLWRLTQQSYCKVQVLKCFIRLTLVRDIKRMKGQASCYSLLFEVKENRSQFQQHLMSSFCASRFTLLFWCMAQSVLHKSGPSCSVHQYSRAQTC